MIGIVGLSHLGIVTAASLAAKGLAVVGVDNRTHVVERLQRGEPGFFEPGLVELLSENASHLSFSGDWRDLQSCEVVYFALDVPTDEKGQSDVEPLAKLISTTMSEAANLRTIYIVLSQVTPGFTRAIAAKYESIAPLWYYQVETLVFGNAVERALRPERYMVGCADANTPLPKEFAAILQPFDCPILPMRYESAELSKISINLFLTSSVSVTNTLAELCEAIGADWREVVPGLRLDRRIGPHAYLSPGLGIAGGNLERDLATISRLASEHGTEAGVVDAWRQNSRRRRDWALAVLHDEVLSKASNPLIAIWGLAYKADTTSIKNSPAVQLIESLASCARIRAYDPQAQVAGNSHFQQVPAAWDACEGAVALAIMTPWKEFAKIDLAEIRERLAGRLVVDPFGVLDASRCREARLDYFRLGCPPMRGTK